MSFEVAFVRVLDILREVAEEGESRSGRRKLRHVFDMDFLALPHRWVVAFDEWKHGFVESCRRDFAFHVLVDLAGLFDDLVDALLLDDGGEDDREVGVSREFGVDSFFPSACCLGVLLDEVPFVDDHYDAPVVFLDEVEYFLVLCFESACCVEHEDADVGVFDGAYGAHGGVEFHVLLDLSFFPESCGIDEVEVHAEFVVAGVDGVAGGAGDVGHYVAVFAEEGVDDGRLACVRSADDCEFRE